MPDIFISYSREDQAVARRFAQAFEREGFSVWWDQSLTPGEAFDQVTEQALDDARAVVVLWSKTSVNSRWVRAEATQANAGSRLMPVMIEPCRRPIMFELTHTADLSGWDGSPQDPAWQSLLAGVRKVTGRETPASTPSSAPVPSAAAAPGAVPRRAALGYGIAGLGFLAAGFAAGSLRLGGGNTPGNGAASPVFQRLTFRRGLVRAARFAPDGRTILYGALWGGERCHIYSTRTDNPESQALDLPEANLLAVSPSGELAIGLGANMEGVFTYGTLARVPGAGGAPRELAENVKFADWSPEGSELAIIRRVDGADRLEFPVGNVVFQTEARDGTGLGFVRVSPDGRRLAFVHYRAPQSLLGKLCVLQDGKVTALTPEYVNIHGLAWRGEEIWYSASDDRPLFRALLAVRPGGEPRIVARLPVNVTLWDAAADGRLLIAQTDDRAALIGRRGADTHDEDLSWLDASWIADLSRDGTAILFSESGQGVGARPAAYLRGMDGSPAIRLGWGMPLALSPDKRWALMADGELRTDRTGKHLEMVATGAGDSRSIDVGELRCTAARWLPDGQRVILQAAEPGRPSRLYLLDVGSGGPQPLSPEGVEGWALSPDGRRVAVAGSQSGIRLLALEGGAPHAVPGTERVLLVGWTRDGLLVMRPEEPSAPRGQVYLLDPASGRQRDWANILPSDGAGIMLLVAFAATPDGGARVFTWHRALSNLYIADGIS